MADLFPDVITPREMTTEAEREVAYRRRVYPRWVAQKKMGQDVADYHLRVMEAIASKLAELERQS